MKLKKGTNWCKGKKRGSTGVKVKRNAESGNAGNEGEMQLNKGTKTNRCKKK